MKQLSVKQQQELIPDEDVRDAFMRRDDIRCLNASEKARRWELHLAALNRFREQLSEIPAFQPLYEQFGKEF